VRTLNLIECNIVVDDPGNEKLLEKLRVKSRDYGIEYLLFSGFGRVKLYLLEEVLLWFLCTWLVILIEPMLLSHVPLYIVCTGFGKPVLAIPLFLMTGLAKSVLGAVFRITNIVIISPEPAPALRSRPGYVVVMLPINPVVFGAPLRIIISVSIGVPADI
jgi:hypothetical protein